MRELKSALHEYVLSERTWILGPSEVKYLCSIASQADALILGSY